MATTYELTTATPLTSEDGLIILQGGTLSELSAASLAEGIVTSEGEQDTLNSAINGLERWTELSTESYGSIPDTASEIELLVSGGERLVGFPGRITQEGETRYTLFWTWNSVTSKVGILHELDTVGVAPITKVEVGKPEMVKQIVLGVPGQVNGAVTQTLLNDTYGHSYTWSGARARIVYVALVCSFITQTEPTFNIRVDGEQLLSPGFQPISGAEVGLTFWVTTQEDPPVIVPANSILDTGSVIEIEVEDVGGTLSRDMTVSIMVIYE